MPKERDAVDKVDIPQGTLDLMILTILTREAMHGYGISQRLAVLSHDHFHVNPGSLFPSLYRLEHDGRLKSSGGRPRTIAAPNTASRLRDGGSSNSTERWDRVSFAVSSVRKAHDAAASRRLGVAVVLASRSG